MRGWRFIEPTKGTFQILLSICICLLSNSTLHYYYPQIWNLFQIWCIHNSGTTFQYLYVNNSWELLKHGLHICYFFGREKRYSRKTLLIVSGTLITCSMPKQWTYTYLNLPTTTTFIHLLPFNYSLDVKECPREELPPQA